MDSLKRLNAEVIACRKCPRLVAHRERVAREKVRRYRDEEYWGKPIPGFGDPKARLLIVGLALRDCFITAAVWCAPPGNKPTPTELTTCRPYLVEEMRLLRNVRIVVVLGRIALDAFLKAWGDAGRTAPARRPAFGHGGLAKLPGDVWLLASYHPSQQNTQTGRLTSAMFQRIFARVRRMLAGPRANRRRESKRRKV